MTKKPKDVGISRRPGRPRTSSAREAGRQMKELRLREVVQGLVLLDQYAQRVLAGSPANVHPSDRSKLASAKRFAVRMASEATRLWVEGRER